MNLKKIKNILSKILTFWLPNPYRKSARNFLIYFSLSDYIRFRNQQYKIVSLGRDCLPRVLFTVAKIKPRKIYGEETCPFDLYKNSGISRVTELIKDDFSTFFDDLIISEDCFPHDLTLSQDRFRKRYLKRIDNFRKILSSDKKIFFVYADYDKIPDKSELQALYNVLKYKRNGKPFELILLTTEYLNNIQDVIQLPEHFRVEDKKWVDYFINKYGEYRNDYTDYCARMSNKLVSIIAKSLDTTNDFAKDIQ